MTDTAATKSFNERIIEEFRANGGKVAGRFEGLEMMVLTTTGAKSGRTHVCPLVCSTDDGRVVVIASMGGAPTNPAWYHNLVANPAVTVEHGTETYPATAVVVQGDERRRLFDQQAAVMPFFHEYEQKTEREIPVIVLERQGS